MSSIEIESASLKAHVLVCAERQMSIKEQLDELKVAIASMRESNAKELGDIKLNIALLKEQIDTLKSIKMKKLIGVAGSGVAAAGGLIWKYILKH